MNDDLLFAVTALNNPGADTDIDFLWDGDIHQTYPGLRATLTVDAVQTAYLQALVAARRQGGDPFTAGWSDPEKTQAYAHNYQGGGIK